MLVVIAILFSFLQLVCLLISWWLKWRRCVVCGYVGKVIVSGRVLAICPGLDRGKVAVCDQCLDVWRDRLEGKSGAGKR